MPTGDFTFREKIPLKHRFARYPRSVWLLCVSAPGGRRQGRRDCLTGHRGVRCQGPERKGRVLPAERKSPSAPAPALDDSDVEDAGRLLGGNPWMSALSLHSPEAGSARSQPSAEAAGGRVSR